MNRLLAFSTWQRTISLLVVSLSLMAVIQFAMYPRVSESTQPLDVQVALSGHAIAEFIGGLKPSQRKAYQINEATVDMVFPFAYSFALAMLTLQLFKAAAIKNKLILYLSLLPFGIAAFDVAENLQILAVMQNFPELNTTLVSGLIFANSAKHLLTVAVFALLLMLAGYLAIQKLRSPPS